MTFSTLLDAAILGQTLFGASYIGISLYFFNRKRRQEAAKRYTAIAATIESIMLPPAAPSYPWEQAAACLATVAVALVVTANAPVAEAQPLLPPAPMADISWTEDDDLDVTLESIADFEATVATATETDAYLATVAEPITCVGIDTALWLSKDAKIVEIRKMCQLLKVKGAARINKANGVAALAQICEDWGCEDSDM